MKQEWWEKKLREDAEVRIQDTDKDWNESYLRPDSSQFLPRKFRARILAQYGAAAAAALVIIAGAGVLIHRSGLREAGIPLESGGISFAESMPTEEETAGSSKAAVPTTTAPDAAGTTITHTTSQRQTAVITAPAAPPAATALSLELGFTTDAIRAEPAAYVQMADGRVCDGRVHRRIRRQADGGQRRTLGLCGAV